MHLVDRHGLAARVDLGPVCAVSAVAPVMVEVGGHDRGCRRPQFRAAGIGIGLERQPFAVRADDLIFVGGSRPDAGRKDFPDPDIGPQAHDMAAAIPVVEIANHRHPARIRRPDGKMHAVRPFMPDRMGAHLVKQAQMRAFGDEIVIHRAKNRPIGIGIVDFPGADGVGRGVAQWLTRLDGETSLEQACHRAGLELAHRAAIKGQCLDIVGAGNECAGEKSPLEFLDAENGKRVSMRSGSDRFCFFCRKAGHLCSGVWHGSLLGHGPAFQISFAYWRMVRSEENHPTRAVLRIVRPYQASSSTHKLST